MSTQTPTRINLAELAMTQQETITKQSRIIARLLTEVAMFRELTQAEEEYAAAFHAGEGKT
jgi:hypothetical protein